MGEYKPKRKLENGGLEEIKIPWALIANVPDYLLKSGGTMTGAITLANGDGKGLLMPSNGTINATSGNATLFGFLSGTLTMGHTSYPLNLRGSQARPTYNGNAIALKSDVPTDYATKAYVDTEVENKVASNFNTNFAAKSVTELRDGGNVVMSTDIITLNGGNA